MPIYEYRCARCGKKESKFWRSLAAINEAQLTCGHCGSPQMTRLVSRVRVLRSGESNAGGLEGGPQGDLDASLMREMESLDENDPRALGRFMRKMAAETGESLGEEFDEVVGRLEKGEDPEKIERDMGELFGGDASAADASADASAGMDGREAGFDGPTPEANGDVGDSKPAKSSRPRQRSVVARKPATRSATTASRSTKTKRKK